MVEPDSELEQKIRQISGCQSLKKGSSFRIVEPETAHGETGCGRSFAMQFTFYVHDAHGYAKIINGSMYEFSCSISLHKKQIKYIKVWLFAHYLWACPKYRNL